MGDLGGIYSSTGSKGGATSFDPSDPGLQAINPHTLFDGTALFSQIIVAAAGRTVWISGLIGVRPDNCLIGPGKREQVEQTFRNIAAAIDAGGCVPKDCVHLKEYIVDYTEADVALLQKHIADYFPAGFLPTNVIVPVPRLGRDQALIEIELACVRSG